VVAGGATERRAQAIGEQLATFLTRERAARRQRRDRASGLAKAAQIVGAVGILATLVCAIGFLAYIRSAILVPLRGVADAARALAAGDLRARVETKGGLGEVGQLAHTFDLMAASLEDSRAALERQNAELEAQSAELAAAASAAREAERVKDDFFALVSHELRTPLTAIVGYVELVLGEDGAALPDEHAHHLAIVDRNAQRLLRLVGDLLFAAQVERGSLLLEPDAVDLPQLVRDAVALVRQRAEDADIALTVEVPPMEPCLGDRDRLAQVLDNLVSNALKFTLPGGRIAVRLTTHGANARIEIADTGVGIPAADLRRPPRCRGSGSG
jgi:signal transduction histidine kinase